VTDLVAPGVVNTVPEATLRLVAGHGVVPADSVRPYYADARQVLDQLGEIGVDYDDAVQTLEDRGAPFDTAWAELGERLAVTLRGAPAQPGG
jgi:transaldolase